MASEQLSHTGALNSNVAQRGGQPGRPEGCGVGICFSAWLRIHPVKPLLLFCCCG